MQRTGIVWTYTWRMLALGFALGGMLGNICGGILILVSSPYLGPAGCLFGIVEGTMYGLPAGLVDGLVLGTIVATRGKVGRRVLGWLSALVAVLVTAAASPFVLSSMFLASDTLVWVVYGAVPAVIAAIAGGWAGWWVTNWVEGTSRRPTRSQQ